MRVTNAKAVWAAVTALLAFGVFGGAVYAARHYGEVRLVDAVVDEIDDDALTRAVIRHPLVKSRQTRYGSSLDPDVKAVRAVAAKLFPAPGGQPLPWPTPKPSATEPSATPEP